jgi:hypothetical protein
MKVPASRMSKYLAKEDVPDSIVATMGSVTIETLTGNQGQEDKYHPVLRKLFSQNRS